MATLQIRPAKTPVALVRRLFDLERRGRYEEALAELTDIWPDHSVSPFVQDLEPIEAGSLLLRCGSLIGFHAHNAQQGSQDMSRDLLTRAQRIFVSLDDQAKIAECENYLALSYWRNGEYREGQVILDFAFSRQLEDGDRVRLHSHIIRCLLNIGDKKDAENLASLSAVEAVFLTSDDDCLKGDYFNHCGIALDNLDRKSEALSHFEVARHYYLRARHRAYLAAVENNLACLYKQAGEFYKAHKAIDSAIKVFRSMKDKAREGFSYDTKAELYIAEVRYVEALNAVNKGLVILRRRGSSLYLVQTLLTKAKILLHLDRFADAVISLVDAVNISRVNNGDSSARRLIDEFESVLNERNATKANATSAQHSPNSFELNIPSSIGHYTDYSGVWINNSRLEGVGVRKGALAIIGKCEIKPGDLAAVKEIESGEVVCGFFDADFGMVCLEGSDGDPQLFDENAIRILGKIVGVCNSEAKVDGKMSVEALKL